MKIAIDISPLNTGHKVRGVGFYLQHLKDALLKYHPENEYHFFTKKTEIPIDADIVHFPYFDPFFITLPIIKRYKTIVTIHDLTPIVFPEHFPAGIKGNLLWQIQKLNLKKVDAIITDSISSQKDISKYTGISIEKINTIYLASGERFKVIKSSSHQVIKEKYNLPEKFALYVGDVTWNKNLPNLIRAVKQSGVHLVMVGKSLAQENFDRSNIWNKDLIEVQELIKNDDHFIRLGFVTGEDLVTLYNLATMFVMPSRYEGFGLPVLEAMQSGCPVVTTHGGSLPEIAGDSAYYTKGFDSDNLANAIKKVFYDKKLQVELSKKGFVQARKFSWKKTADETLVVYKKVINSRI